MLELTMLRMRDEFRSGAWVSGSAGSRFISLWAIDAAGCLDATDTIPAGSVDCVTWVNGNGKPAVRPTQINRE